MQITFDAFHGTSMESATLIVSSNFVLSLGDKEWLGDGVYFFIEGISSKPIEQAKQWAIAEAWDNTNKCYKYNKYGVIQSNIIVDEDKFLDLTKEDGVEILAYILECHQNKIKRINKKFDYLDGTLINFARGENLIEVDVVKGNFYIKFTQSRIKNANLRTSNCTICAVVNPEKHISKSSLRFIGKIKDETN